MVQIPVIYPPSPQPIASFDFVNLAEGTGTVIYFGITSNDTGSLSYHLVSNSAVWSSTVETTRGTEGTTTVDFDSAKFNLPRFVKGTAFFSGAIGSTSNPGSRSHLQVQLKKWDGSSETNLTAEVTGIETQASGGRQEFYVMPITTENLIKKGEQLRLTVKLVQDGGSAFNHSFAHDPANTDGAIIVPSTQKTTTIMRMLVPFRIES